MKKVLLVLLLGCSWGIADSADAPPGFVDKDKDGINDAFRDANGDGVNDVTGKPYPHSFKFEDKNGDKLNDLFVDRDGDGVNDLSARFVDANGDGFCDNVVDADNDGINDVTGLRYGKRGLLGFRHGYINEERGTGRWRMDRFFDADGDGICDGRSVSGQGGRRHRGGR